MTLAKAKAGVNKIFIVQASLKIVTYDHQNSFIGHAAHCRYVECRSIECRGALKEAIILVTTNTHFGPGLDKQ